MPERHDRNRHDVIRQREQRGELRAESDGDRRERAAEPARRRREQQVLHRGEDRRRHRLLEPAIRCRRTRRRAPGAAATPPVAPRSTSSSIFGVSRFSENARPPLSQARRVRSPIAARARSSRTTTNSHGCRFSALGAYVAALEDRGDVVVAHRCVREGRGARAGGGRRRRSRHSLAHPDPRERVHVHDAQLRMERPALQRVASAGRRCAPRRAASSTGTRLPGRRCPSRRSAGTAGRGRRRSRTA